MAKIKFLPYKYSKKLTLEIKNIAIDGVDKPELIDRDNKNINLYEQGLSGKIKIAVKVKVPEECTKLIPEEEAQSPNWKVITKITCDTTKYREGYNLTEDGNKFEWNGEFTLPINDLNRKADIQTYLVRSKPTPAGNGVARFSNVRIGESKVWSLQLEKPKPPAGQYLKVTFENFSQHETLHKYKDSVYYLDTDDSPPKIILNSETDQLEPLLNSGHKHSMKAYIRDQLVDSIVINSWIVLFTKSAENCEDGHEPSKDWQQLVLKSISQLFYDQLDADEAYNKLLSEIEKSENISSFLPELSLHLQTFKGGKVNLKTNIEKTIKSLFK